MPHTPGPWDYTYDGCSDWSIGEADDPQEKRVASVWDRNDERARANCQLIAAAPAMLSLLESLEWSVGVESKGDCPVCCATTPGPHAPDCKLAAVLKKAKGA